MINFLSRFKEVSIKGWSRKRYSGYKESYDFSWIDEAIQGWSKEYITLENIECRLPSGILYYFDYPGSTNNCPVTRLGERIPDYNEYLEQKRDYIRRLIKKRVG